MLRGVGSAEPVTRVPRYYPLGTTHPMRGEVITDTACTSPMTPRLGQSVREGLMWPGDRTDRGGIEPGSMSGRGVF